MYKKFLVFTLLLAIAFTAIAQTSNLDQSSSANLETALKNNDFDAVSTILNEADADIAPQFEATILQAAKNAVIKNKLDDAFKLAEIVLYYNFDNTEAQDLYTSIQQQKNKAVAAAEAKKKVEEQKKEEKFINDVKFIGIDDFSFGIAVTPAAMDFLTSDPVKKVYKTDGFSCRYGFGVDGFVAFNHPFIKVQLGVIWNLLPVNIAGESSHNLIDARFTLESPAFVKYLTITAGYRNSSMGESSSGIPSAFLEKYGSAFVGVGVSNIKLPLGFYITAFADWNMVSAFQEMVSFSMNIEFILQWYSPLKIGKNPVYIKSRTAYTGMYYSNDVGSDNTILTSLSIGVSFNEER